MSVNIVTAVDLGSDSVRVVTLRRRKGAVELLGAGLASVADLDHNDPNHMAELAAAVQRVVKKEGIRVGYTVVGLSGRGTMIRYLSVPVVPPWKLELVMGFEVEEQVGAGRAAESIAYDYRILSIPRFDEGQFPMFLGLAQTTVIDERLDVCRRGLRRSDDVDLQCLGAFNLFRRSPQCQEDEFSLLLDIGAAETQLTLQEGASLLFARTLSSGGRQFTTNLQQKLGLLGPEAEEYKRTQACIIPRSEQDFFSEESVNASQACRAAVGMLTSAIESSCRYYYNQFRLADFPVAKVFVTGGGSRLGGLTEALGEAFHCPVEMLDVGAVIQPHGAAAEAALTGESAHHFAGAIGLAMGQLSNGFTLSLLPPRVKERRRFWARDVYTYYAGALAAVLLVLVFLGSRREAVYETERYDKWQKHLKQAERQHKDLNNLKQENKRLYNRLRTLEVRQASGDDLLRCLLILKEKTPKDIFFTEFETSGRIEEDARKDVREGEAAPKDNEGGAASFQKSRHIILRGYVVGAKDDIAARQRLRKLADALEALPFFSRVQPRRQEPLGRDAEEVVAAYQMGTINAKPPNGVALKFVMQCMISIEHD